MLPRVVGGWGCAGTELGEELWIHREEREPESRTGATRYRGPDRQSRGTGETELEQQAVFAGMARTRWTQL